jgi:hypothetical protein
MTVIDAGTPYGLHRPTMHDAYEAIHRVHSDDGPAIWARLLSAAGLNGGDSGEPALLRLLKAMEALDPVSRLCAHAMRIRLTSHTHLAAAHTLMRS